MTRLLDGLVLGMLLTAAACIACQRAQPSAEAVQAQAARWAPPAGHSCTLQGGKPDPACTPGLTNPAVTPGTLAQTVCQPNWTRTIRPPTSYTSALKRLQLNAGYTIGNDIIAGDYEEDHFLPLSLGGHPTDPRNLWPQPYRYQFGGQLLGAHQKDELENELHRLVCLPVDAPGRLPLEVAQQAILQDWPYAWATYVRTPSALLGGAVMVDPDDEEETP